MTSRPLLRHDPGRAGSEATSPQGDIQFSMPALEAVATASGAHRLQA